MTLRHRPLWCCALWLLSAPLLAAPPVESTPAVRLWEQGQDAMRDGRNDDAVRFYQQSLQLDPQLARNFLSLAAAHIADGHDDEAIHWLGRYVEAQPDHHVVRLHYAELLVRNGKVADGRAQLERFIADVQDREDLAAAHLLDCHTKLVEIAEAGEDEYGEHLHRGIGLFLLGCQRAQLTGADDGFSAESLWLKAAAELGQARLRRPAEARPCWYLHEVWSHLAQQHPATRWLRAAESAAPFSYLTPAEQRGLRLACRQREDEGRLK
jgi:tetratricopeptide (TPR) repeat protein